MCVDEGGMTATPLLPTEAVVRHDTAIAGIEAGLRRTRRLIEP